MRKRATKASSTRRGVDAPPNRESPHRLGALAGPQAAGNTDSSRQPAQQCLCRLCNTNRSLRRSTKRVSDRNGLNLPRVLPRSLAYSAVLTILVGNLSAILPIRKQIAGSPKMESTDLQERCGAPGWNRTSDTRFRKHAEGVIARGASCGNVLHSPRFCPSSVLWCAQACWAVVSRLVGNVSAVKLAEEAGGDLSAQRRDWAA